jgi:hypothetical protein
LNVREVSSHSGYFGGDVAGFVSAVLMHPV